MRGTFDAICTRSFQEQREAFERMANTRSPALAKVKRKKVDAGGVPSEWFTPRDHGDAVVLFMKLVGKLPEGTHELKNSDGRKGWTPPCPPSGTHHYRFTVYALNKMVNAASLDGAFTTIEKAAIAQGTLTGLVSH